MRRGLRANLKRFPRREEHKLAAASPSNLTRASSTQPSIQKLAWEAMSGCEPASRPRPAQRLTFVKPANCGMRLTCCRGGSDSQDVLPISAPATATPSMAQRVGIWLFWRIRRLFLGAYARGSNKTTPVESLNLQPGELVEVRPIENIVETLNETAHNRGLRFSPDMRLLCGKQQQVARRIDKLIVDGTGEMRQLRNTVYLEGSHCGCAYVAFGGCSRCEFVYWREIWLRRPAGTT